MKNIPYLGLGLLLFFSSCLTWKDISISKIEQVRISNIDKDGIQAEVDVKINNPNTTGFTVYGSEIRVSLNGNNVGMASLNENVHIKAGVEDVYTLKVSGKTDNLLSGSGLFGLVSIATSGRASIDLSGYVSAGKFFIRKRFPIEVRQDVPVFR